MTATVIVPVKGLSVAKSRLADALSPLGRQALARVLLRHVVEAARDVVGGGHLLLLSADPEVEAEANTAGVVFLPEEPEARGLNDAVERALRTLRVGDPAPAIVLFADLPIVQADDVATAIQMLELDPDAVVLGPSTRGGMSLLGCFRNTPAEMVFGEHSYARFAALCDEAGIRTQKLVRPGLYQDLDEPEDIEAVLASPICPERIRKVLQVASRLRS